MLGNPIKKILVKHISASWQRIEPANSIIEEHKCAWCQKVQSNSTSSLNSPAEICFTTLLGHRYPT